MNNNLNDKNQYRLKQKRDEAMKNKISMWSKVIGLVVLAIIIVGVGMSDNGKHRSNSEIDSMIEYEDKSKEELSLKKDGRMIDKDDIDQVEDIKNEDKEKKEVKVDNNDKSDEKAEVKKDNKKKENEQRKVESKVDAVSNSKKFEEASENKVDNNSNASSNKSNISRDSAKNIAFKNAGVVASKVRNLEIDLDYENGKKIYEVSFDYENAEYDYDIDASSGKIIRKEKDLERIDYDDRYDRDDNDRYDD